MFYPVMKYNGSFTKALDGGNCVDVIYLDFQRHFTLYLINAYWVNWPHLEFNVKC